MKAASLIIIAFVTACAAVGSTTAADRAALDQTTDSVQTNGSLRLETHDAPLTPSNSAYDTVPQFTGVAGAITIARAQLGSLCLTALTGSADRQGDRIGVHILFTERLTSCTGEVRVLQYNATVTAPAGTYNVALVHERNGVVDTIARKSVTVR